MFKTILLCYDGSREGRAVLTDGAETGRAAEEILHEGTAKLASMGLKAQGHVVIGDPIGEIAAAARRLGADLIVLGHRPRGPLARWWQSSVGSSLLEEAPCSILVAIEAGPDRAQA